MELVKDYRQTAVGEIPEDWDVNNISENSTLKARIGWQGLTTSEYLSIGDYYLVTGTDFIDGKIKWETCHFVNKERFIQDKNIQVKIGDILITKDGTIGKVAYVDRLPLQATLNSGVFVIRPKNDAYNPLYCYYVFNSSYFDIFLKRLVAGSTINHLYQKDFISFNFPLPPTKAEQVAIATALSDADSLITSLEKLIKKKRAIKQGAMQQLLKPKKDWVEKTLKEVAKFRRGSFPQPYGLDKWYDDVTGFPFVQVYDVDDNFKLKGETKWKISKEAQAMSVFIAKGSIILTIQGSIGRIAITQYDSYVDRTLLLFESFTIPFDKYFFLLSIFILFEKEKQTAPGGIIKTITKEALSSFKISYPKIEEQHRIAKIIFDMNEDIFALEQNLSKYKMLMQGMMQELLTGKTRLV